MAQLNIRNLKKLNGPVISVISVPILILLLVFTSFARANDPLRLISDSEINPSNKVQTQTFHRIKTASVAWANYDAIRRDFNEVHDWTETQIDNWIIENFAFINSNQLNLNGIRNNSIEHTSDSRTFYIPQDYGRAAVGPAQIGKTTVGLVDLKGIGLSRLVLAQNQVRDFTNLQSQLAKNYLLVSDDQAKNAAIIFARNLLLAAIDELRIKDHNDGLMSLGEAIAEITRQTAIQIGFNRIELAAEKSASPRRHLRRETVENYFILSLGFNILKDHGTSIPAGLIGRQAHFRGGTVQKSTVYTDPFGMLQGSASGASVDFGGAIIQIPELKERFGVIPGGNENDPQQSKAWAWAHDVARYFSDHIHQNSNQARQAVNRHINEMLAPFSMKDHAAPSYSASDLVWFLTSSEVNRVIVQNRIRTLIAATSGIENKHNLVKFENVIIQIADLIQPRLPHPIFSSLLHFLSDTKLILEPKIKTRIEQIAFDTTDINQELAIATSRTYLESHHLIKDDLKTAIRRFDQYILAGLSQRQNHAWFQPLSFQPPGGVKTLDFWTPGFQAQGIQVPGVQAPGFSKLLNKWHELAAIQNPEFMIHALDSARRAEPNRDEVRWILAMTKALPIPLSEDFRHLNCQFLF
jgi:hypothetical protein